MRTPINIQLLVVFCEVAEQTSFSKAAKRLGIAKGTVSRSIAQLESLLEVELIHRTTHHVSLSTAGVELFARTRSHLVALKAAVQELPELDEEPSGLLRITTTHDFGTILLPPLLAAFSRRYPGIRFDVRLTQEVVDLVKEGYDLAIRGGTGPMKDSTLTIRPLYRSSTAFYAAPSYVARRGRTQRVGDEHHTWIIHGAMARFLPLGSETIRFMVDNFQLARDLARDGMGIAVLPSFVARDYVRDGLLEELSIPDASVMNSELVLLYPSSGQLPKKVSSFRDFLIEAFRSGLA
jgi:DNA-binding transcriptional LysR family regulator